MGINRLMCTSGLLVNRHHSVDVYLRASGNRHHSVDVHLRASGNGHQSVDVYFRASGK